MIGIIDYGAGNLKNVHSAVTRLGSEALISSDPNVLGRCSGLILPGVGAFGDAMDMLNSGPLRQFLDNWVADGHYLMGICLGMQMLFETSYEFGTHKGLGYIKGEVLHFPEGLKIPHMGWNELDIVQEDPLIRHVQSKDYVYFVHSYYGKASEDNVVLAYANYGVPAVAIVRKGNVMGTQFHPEKSGATGSIILKNFLEMTQ